MRGLCLLLVLSAACASNESARNGNSDPTATATAFQAACDRGDARACEDLGWHQSIWRVVPHDEARALSSFARGCELGAASACARQALMREAGRGAPLDLGEASRLHERACSLGLAWSCEDQRRLAEFAELPGELTRDPGCDAACDGGLEKQEIYRVMMRSQGPVRYCYELALGSDQNLTADVSTKFVIDAEGRVAQSEAPGATDGSLAACVTRALRDFRFPRPRGGGVVNVTFPYLFRTANSVDAGNGPRVIQ